MAYLQSLPRPEAVLKENYVRFVESPGIQRFLERGGSICIACNGRPLEDLLVLAELGHQRFGEKYVQEGAKKLQNLYQHYPEIRRQYFGKLQTNKIKQVVTHFDHVESVASKREIDHLVKYRNTNNEFDTKSFFLQVNIGAEPQKNGVSPDRAREVLNYATSKGLQIDGLMGIPPKLQEPKSYFKALRKLADQLALPGCQMGFSKDYKEAIAQGSTHLRIGSLVFDGCK
ncbi:MAG: alanine racemase [Lunatimonas sp.]|uniref:alanine racemase n=1 Tax=Lunatimonas sp. TaxID=2060141 RepID=UPI00263BBF4D|nr:alanine racemase [Lunatimonas sp.]MCC5936527.1 alanine racemase [Lunatimonas sp.]